MSSSSCGHNMLHQFASAFENVLYPHVAFRLCLDAEEVNIVLVCIFEEGDFVDRLDRKRERFWCLHLRDTCLRYDVGIEIGEMAQ
jgi:hypothetical protein